MFKCYENPISTGEQKHRNEVELCQMADFVVGIGPKLTKAFRGYLSWCKKDVFSFTPGVFDDFSMFRKFLSTENSAMFWFLVVVMPKILR